LAAVLTLTAQWPLNVGCSPAADLQLRCREPPQWVTLDGSMMWAACPLHLRSLPDAVLRSPTLRVTGGCRRDIAIASFTTRLRKKSDGSRHSALGPNGEVHAREGSALTAGA